MSQAPEHPAARLVLPLDGTPVRVIPPVDIDAHEATQHPEEIR
jgi:hypothetical protein